VVSISDYEKSRPWMESAADLVIDTTNLSVADVAERITAEAEKRIAKADRANSLFTPLTMVQTFHPSSAWRVHFSPNPTGANLWNPTVTDWDFAGIRVEPGYGIEPWTFLLTMSIPGRDSTAVMLARASFVVVLVPVNVSGFRLVLARGWAFTGRDRWSGTAAPLRYAPPAALPVSVVSARGPDGVHAIG
jgi:hypothetical protein